MDSYTIDRLEHKGWTSDEIEKARRILETAQEKKSQKILVLDAVIYWVALFVAILGNVVVSVVLIPFLLALRDILLYVIIITLGVAFGLLFDLLIRDIDTLSSRHYIIAGIFIPCLAITNVFLMANFSNTLTVSMHLKNIHPPLLVGAVYTIAFIAPYLLSHFTEGHYSLRKRE